MSRRVVESVWNWRAAEDPLRHRIAELIRSAGLPWQIPKDIALHDLVAAMEVDKKSLAGKIKFVLCSGIGATRFKWLAPQEILERLSH